MHKRSITYTDFNDVTRTEDFYFNLTKAELIELRYSARGGLENVIQDLINSKDEKEIISLVKEIILMSYGRKSTDGKAFVKSPGVREEFEYSPAFSALFMELATDDEKAQSFINSILPQDQDAPIVEGQTNALA